MTLFNFHFKKFLKCAFAYIQNLDIFRVESCLWIACMQNRLKENVQMIIASCSPNFTFKSQSYHRISSMLRLLSSYSKYIVIVYWIFLGFRGSHWLQLSNSYIYTYNIYIHTHIYFKEYVYIYTHIYFKEYVYIYTYIYVIYIHTHSIYEWIFWAMRSWWL